MQIIDYTCKSVINLTTACPLLATLGIASYICSSAAQIFQFLNSDQGGGGWYRCCIGAHVIIQGWAGFCVFCVCFVSAHRSSCNSILSVCFITSRDIILLYPNPFTLKYSSFRNSPKNVDFLIVTIDITHDY